MYAVNKAMENHCLKGESIAIADEQGVKIVPAKKLTQAKKNT